MKLLMVEDDIHLAQTLKERLSKHYVVDMVHTGKEAEDFLRLDGHDMVILDLSLPDMDGISLCKKIRRTKKNMPILMLTGAFEVNQKVLALDAGCDDYLTKPFNFEELHARIRALLRRREKPIESEVLTVGDLKFNVEEGHVERTGILIQLRRKQLRLLEYFMRNVGRVLTREMILDKVWGNDNDSMNNIVDVHVKYLRDAIDRPFQTKLIKTIHGMGYKLDTE